MSDQVAPEALEDYELALARLQWVQSAHCLQLPEQARAVEWHVSACDAALSAIAAQPDGAA